MLGRRMLLACLFAAGGARQLCSGHLGGMSDASSSIFQAKLKKKKKHAATRVNILRHGHPVTMPRAPVCAAQIAVAAPAIVAAIAIAIGVTWRPEGSDD